PVLARGGPPITAPRGLKQRPARPPTRHPPPRPPQKKKPDRPPADIGNIVNLGHINVNISDQRLGTHYYISGLGLTRDPFLNTGVRIMWVNVGMSQIHLPTGQPSYLRGTTRLVMPERAAGL